MFLLLLLLHLLPLIPSTSPTPIPDKTPIHPTIPTPSSETSIHPKTPLLLLHFFLLFFLIPVYFSYNVMYSSCYSSNYPLPHTHSTSSHTLPALPSSPNSNSTTHPTIPTTSPPTPFFHTSSYPFSTYSFTSCSS